MKPALYLSGLLLGLTAAAVVLAVRGAERWSERAWGRDE